MLAIHPLRFTYIISGVIGLLGLDLLLALVLFRRAARAVTLNVTSNGDGSDSDLTDGVCNDGTGKCTLRAAIAQANSAAAINIPMGIHTLTLGIELTIEQNLTLEARAPGTPSSRRLPNLAWRTSASSTYWLATPLPSLA